MSSVHTSDLSSFEGESEDEGQKSDSSEEGELPADGLYFSSLSLPKPAVLYHDWASSSREICVLAEFLVGFCLTR